MYDRPLKHYDTWLRRIKSYARSHGIKIRRVHLPHDEGYYVADRRIVYVDKGATEVDEISTMLHELGHDLDYYIQPKGKEKLAQMSYAKIYNGIFNRKDKKIVVECENRAWEYGRAIAKILKIPLGKWYDDAVKSGLEYYKSL